MTAYLIRCMQCANREHHGFTRPESVDCHTARLMRASCRDLGCKLDIVEYEVDLTDVDKLRLGLRADEPRVTT